MFEVDADEVLVALDAMLCPSAPPPSFQQRGCVTASSSGEERKATLNVVKSVSDDSDGVEECTDTLMTRNYDESASAFANPSPQVDMTRPALQTRAVPSRHAPVESTTWRTSEASKSFDDNSYTGLFMRSRQLSKSASGPLTPMNCNTLGASRSTARSEASPTDRLSRPVSAGHRSTASASTLRSVSVVNRSEQERRHESDRIASAGSSRRLVEEQRARSSTRSTRQLSKSASGPLTPLNCNTLGPSRSTARFDFSPTARLNRPVSAGHRSTASASTLRSVSVVNRSEHRRRHESDRIASAAPSRRFVEQQRARSSTRSTSHAERGNNGGVFAAPGSHRRLRAEAARPRRRQATSRRSSSQVEEHEDEHLRAYLMAVLQAVEEVREHDTVENSCPSAGDVQMAMRKLRIFQPVSDSPEACAICLEDMARGQPLAQLPCHHCFHAACIRSWLPSSLTCPLCKRDVASKAYKTT
eukprot:TRINITY_DN8980_c0_g1_i2.p1 TRINITY_DN8980_c0_g1~~TRINITY_DN8980_c0_g1_i2.p1  ORF type:complete len:494 (+),score=23.95 TRINITY_DN8980_c0_g1_i2:67-1482(+)